MLAGTVVSAVMGGAAGLIVALLHQHGLLQTFFAYQLGGGLATMAFLAAALRPELWRN